MSEKGFYLEKITKGTAYRTTKFISLTDIAKQNGDYDPNYVYTKKDVESIGEMMLDSMGYDYYVSFGNAQKLSDADFKKLETLTIERYIDGCEDIGQLNTKERALFVDLAKYEAGQSEQVDSKFKVEQKLTDIFTSKMFDMTPQGAGKWRKEERPIVKFLNQYFTKEDLQEFLDKGSIKALDEFKAFKDTCENDPLFKQYLEFKEFQAYKEKTQSKDDVGASSRRASRSR